MGVLSPPYDIRVWLYPGANPAGTPTDWGIPLDISSYVRQPGDDGGQAISYTVGRTDEASQVDASSLSLTLDNRTGLFSTKNVASSLYGQLKRGTPIAVGMTTGYDSFSRTTTASNIGNADSGQFWARGAGWHCDGSKALVAPGGSNTISFAYLTNTDSADYDMTVQVIPQRTALGATYIGGLLQYTGTGGAYVMYKVNFYTSGNIDCGIQVTNGGNQVASASLGTYSTGNIWNVRAQRTGQDLRMKVWLNTVAEPSAWTVTTTDTLVAPYAVGMFCWQTSGSTNGNVDMVGFDNFLSVGIEYVGNVVQWPVRWDTTSNNSWAPIQAAGILRRLQQGKGAIRSPLTRQLGSANPTGWWTLEDGSGAAYFSSQVAGVQPAAYFGVTLAGDNSLPGSGNTATLSATNGFIRGATPKRVGGGVKGFSAMIFTKFAGGLPTTKTRVAAWAATGRVTQWYFSMDSTAVYVDGYDQDGTLVTSGSGLFGLDPTQWVAWQLETDVVGSNVQWSFISHQVSAVVFLATTGSFASTTPMSVTNFTLGNTNLPVGTAFSQSWVGPNTLPFVDNGFSLVSSGYAGELAGDRMARLCREEGISFKLEPGTTDPVGIQPQTDILNALRMAADADMGILYESGTGLGYRPRSTRFQQPVGLSLAVASGHVAQPPEPIDDDQRYRNKWTVTNDGGGYAVAQNDSEIALQGLYEDTVTLTLYSDDYAAYHAGFRLYLGTWPDLRWPGLSLNLGRNPSLVPAWRSRSYGMRMQVTTGLSQTVGSDPDVIIEGYTATLWPNGWTVDLNCSTATAWDIATLDDSLNRLDADNSDIAVAVTTLTPTTITVTNNGDPGNTWVPTSQYPAEVPFTISINGDQFSVTNVGDLSGNNQVLTVTRVNPLTAKTHAVGEAVTLAKPMYIAM